MRAPERDSAGLQALYLATIKALDPAAYVREHLQREPLAGEEITLLALGKAAVPMALGAQAVLGPRVVAQIVVAPELPPQAPAGWMASSHPRITADSEKAGRALLRAAAEASGPVLALVSGGGSALAAVPAPGLRLAQKSELVQRVYAAGASIEELNTVRKHLSALKGGRLAAVAGAPVATLLVSDVVGDAPGTIASGPTLPDPSMYAEALEVVHSRLGSDAFGPALLHLERGQRGEIPETPRYPRPGDTHHLLAGMSALVDMATTVARREGRRPERLGPLLEGSVEEVAGAILQRAAHPALWIGGGEATIALPETPGCGGRAQQLALYLAREIEGRSDLEILVAGSDGIDGNSQAAGAIIDGDTCRRLREAGIDPDRALSACDAGTALGALGAQILVGPTGVNHADLILVSRAAGRD